VKELNQYDQQIVAPGFDAVAARYGEVVFLRRAAAFLVDSIPRAALTQALDVATGPGTAAVLLAQRLPGPWVTGIDISSNMIAIARARAESMALKNVSFTTGSATALPFEAERFDLVICSNAIYYMPDFAQAVGEWSRVLRPGGRLAFSTFGTGMLEPMSSLFDSGIRTHGILVPKPTPLYRLTSPDECRRLLEDAGLDHVRIQERQLGYWISDVEAWWTTMMSTGFRLLVASLDDEQRKAFEREHKQLVAEHIVERGLWMDVPVIVATGTWPS
jgi:ubiquinone/menaquinone biosynthesis C-methylase UbiE